jgi:1L-myo-inositol 1-phosphate cytidylyltransferase / CDP-L-myo-inositol myo-inositolphosphotransferase
MGRGEPADYRDRRMVSSPDEATDPRVAVPTTAVVVATEGDLRLPPAHPAVLRRVGGVRLIERTVKQLRAAGLERIVIVAGHRADEVAQVVRSKRLPAEVVIDPAWADGTASAVLLGLAATNDDRVLVVMGDHLFEADDVRRVLKESEGNVLAIDREVRRQVGGLGGRRPALVTTDHDRVVNLGDTLTNFNAVDAGFMMVRRSEAISFGEQPGARSWLELRIEMLRRGCVISTSTVDGLAAAVDAAQGVRPLERVMWGRYGPKPTDGFIARLLLRRLSGPTTRQLLRIGMSPHIATVLAFTVTLIAAALLATGNRWLLLVGGVGVVLGCALDGVDGELARVSGRATRRGALLDTLLDRYADLAVVIALVIGAGGGESDAGARDAWIWGLAAGVGCLLVSYVHAVGRDLDVHLLFRREFRLLILAAGAIAGEPLAGVVVVALAANIDVIRGLVLLLRAS